MFESIVTGLVLAAVSAVVFVAYQHPKLFRKIERELNWGSTALFFAAFGYSIGTLVAKSKVALGDPNYSATIRAIDQISVDPIYVGFAWILFTIAWEVLKHGVTRMKDFDADDK